MKRRSRCEIVAHGKSADECRAKIDAAKAAIRERMGEQVFGEEDEELEHVVVRMLNDRRLTFATAEIGTGGLLTRRITEVAGQDDCFRGGLIAPTVAALASVLADPSDPSRLHDALALTADVDSKSEEHAQIAAVAKWLPASVSGRTSFSSSAIFPRTTRKTRRKPHQFARRVGG